jgi:hypothetical protein
MWLEIASLASRVSGISFLSELRQLIIDLAPQNTLI